MLHFSSVPMTIQFVHPCSSPFYYSPSFIFILNSGPVCFFSGPEGKAASGTGVPCFILSVDLCSHKGVVVVMSRPSSGGSTSNLVQFINSSFSLLKNQQA